MGCTGEQMCWTRPISFRERKLICWWGSYCGFRSPRGPDEPHLLSPLNCRTHVETMGFGLASLKGWGLSQAWIALKSRKGRGVCRNALPRPGGAPRRGSRSRMEHVVGNGDQNGTAAVLAELLYSQREWQLRKVQSHVLQAGTYTTVRVSIDCVIQDFKPLRYLVMDSPTRADLQAAPVMVPVTYINKGVLRSFDMRGPDGEILPVLGRSEYKPRLVDVLMQEVGDAVQSGGDDATLRRALGDILDADVDQALEVASELVKLGTINGTHALVPGKLTDYSKSLILKLASAFVLIALVPPEYAGKRVILKYSHHAKLQPDGLNPVKRLWGAAGLSTLEVAFSLSNPTGSASHHLEVGIPPALACTRLAMPSVKAVDRNTQDMMVGGVVHAVAAYPDDPEDDAFIELRVPWDGLRATTFFIALTTFVTIGLGKFLPGAQDALLQANDGAAALLLALPAVVLVLVAARRESALEAALLGPLRLIVLTCALLLFACAASVVGVLHEPWRAALWISGCAVTGVLAILLCARELKDVVGGT